MPNGCKQGGEGTGTTRGKLPQGPGGEMARATPEDAPAEQTGETAEQVPPGVYEADRGDEAAELLAATFERERTTAFGLDGFGWPNEPGGRRHWYPNSIGIQVEHVSCHQDDGHKPKPCHCDAHRSIGNINQVANRRRRPARLADLILFRDESV